MTVKKVTKPASTDIVGGTLHRGEKTEPVSLTTPSSPAG